MTILLSSCGRSDAIVVITLHPTKPNIIYVATNDYIFKSRDEGQTWENISKGMTHSRVIALGIDPVYPATIYAGTKGDAVFKSFDGGQRWVSRRNGLDDVTISSVVNQFVFDPYDHEKLFVATTMGVFESQDAGDSWQKRMNGMKEVLMVITLAMDPKNTSILYAGTSGGIYKSEDRGNIWSKRNNGLVDSDVIQSSRSLDVTMIRIDPWQTQTVYAATLQGLFKTTDGGDSWSRIAESLPDHMIIALALDHSSQDVLYVASREGIHKSADGGVTWEAKNEGFTSSNIRSLAQSATNPNIWYAGTNGSGLYRTIDGGDHWTQLPAVKEQEKKGGRTVTTFFQNLHRNVSFYFSSTEFLGFQGFLPRTRTYRNQTLRIVCDIIVRCWGRLGWGGWRSRRLRYGCRFRIR